MLVLFISKIIGRLFSQWRSYVEFDMFFTYGKLQLRLSTIPTKRS